MKRYFLTGFLALFFVAAALAQSTVDKQTFLYSVKGADSLFLDRYELPAPDSVKKPCLVFVFGGGFYTGSRDRKEYLPYFDHFARKGYVVVSIDYRLGMKSFVDSPASQKTMENFAAALFRSVGMAVEDLYDATGFILSRAGQWNIDPSRVVASGSSAGAITVLQGEYGISNADPLSGRLPRGFNYAGVISFAGAILSHQELRWNKNPCPIQFFHGTADANVPYGKMGDGFGGLYGPGYISAWLTGIKVPHYFYSVQNADHSMAVSPMTDNLAEITIFLDRLVWEKKPWIIDTSVDLLNVPPVDKAITMQDFIRNNFYPN